ncbi:MAG: hypothetical protein GY793_07505 [Proteobacteria bacterium]|nr:hypothetical protein [Pseudomonadota bacterium]
MGTNYYTKINICKTCGREDNIHLGRSSAGWQFSFQYNDGKYYKNIIEMREWLASKNIKNEYGDSITHKDFWDMVENKQENKHQETTGHILIDGYKFFNTEFS